MGWLANKPGSAILKESLKDIKNRYTLLIFALATSADEEAISYLQRTWADIDRLTGKRILFVAFYNTEAGNYRAPEFKFDISSQLIYQPNTIDNEVFSNSMTDESYRLAEFLDIAYSNLPCLVFIETNNASEFRISTLKDVPSREITQYLREFVTDYYNHGPNYEYFHNLVQLEALLNQRSETVRTIRHRELNTRQWVADITKAIRVRHSKHIAQEIGLTQIKHDRGLLASLSKIKVDDMYGILLGWIYNNDAHLLNSCISDQNLDLFHKWIAQLDYGGVQIEYKATKQRMNTVSGNLKQVLFEHMNELISRKQSVNIQVWNVLQQDNVLDNQKIVETISKLNHLIEQLELQLEDILHDLTDRAIQKNLSNTEIDLLTSQISSLRAQIQVLAFPSAFLILDGYHKRSRVQLLVRATREAIRDYGPTVAELFGALVGSI